MESLVELQTRQSLANSRYRALGAEIARLGLSVGQGACEPQCASVKRLSPVITERKPMLCPEQQAAALTREARVSANRRGHRAWRACEVHHSYLGDLTIFGGKADKSEQTLKDGGASLTGYQESDYLIVALKCVKAHGVKGITSRCNSKTKHEWLRRSWKSEN